MQINCIKQVAVTHPSHVYPPLQQPGSLVGLQRGVAQAGSDDTVGDGVELSHSGSDGGSQVLFSLLIPLRPNPPQAVVGHHLLKEILTEMRYHKCSVNTLCKHYFTDQTWN